MNTENNHNPLGPTRTTALIRILAILLVLAIVFWAGMALGYRKAEYSYRFSDNYFRAFGTRGGHMVNQMMPRPDELLGGHGSAGKVVSATLPTLIVSDRDGTEKTIRVTNETLVRSARTTTASTTIKTDDFVVVIGSPNEDGSITAKLIRIMPAQMMSSTTAPNMMYIRQ